MKTLKNNFTTPEQSRRLLELGVPADSADLILIREKSGDMQFYDNEFEKQVLNWDEKFSDWDTVYWHSTHHVLPCWSVGRLIEIWNICANLMPGMDLEFSPSSNSYIEDLVRDFELAGEDSLIDFSKLED